jgi:hypothetical protein
MFYTNYEPVYTTDETENGVKMSMRYAKKDNPNPAGNLQEWREKDRADFNSRLQELEKGLKK